MYRTESANAAKNSVRNSERADWASLRAMRFPSLTRDVGAEAGELKHRRYYYDHDERDRQEHLPAEPHQLVVAIARHEGLDHREAENHRPHLDEKPDDAGHPGEGRKRQRRQPPAEEQHGR